MLLRKTAVTLFPSNESYHVSEVSNKTYRFWVLYEIMHSGVKARDFSKLNN